MKSGKSLHCLGNYSKETPGRNDFAHLLTLFMMLLTSSMKLLRISSCRKSLLAYICSILRFTFRCIE